MRWPDMTIALTRPASPGPVSCRTVGLFNVSTLESSLDICWWNTSKKHHTIFTLSPNENCSEQSILVSALAQIPANLFCNAKWRFSRYLVKKIRSKTDQRELRRPRTDSVSGWQTSSSSEAFFMGNVNQLLDHWVKPRQFENVYVVIRHGNTEWNSVFR